ncbi:MAG: hypothetical protein ABGZ37_01000 [Akkermansiaceae bacterium]
MKTLLRVLFLSWMATSLALAGNKIRWPRDVVEWEKLKASAEVAEKEEMGYAFIFVPTEWGEDLDGSVGRSIAATNDAIRALKSFCLIVKGDFQAVGAAQRGKEEAAPKALVAGVSKAGNSYPLVVVLDTEMKTVLGAVSGQKIHDEGKKVFRDAKKKFREIEKAKEEEKK